jgi:hypothetical protein
MNHHRKSILRKKCPRRQTIRKIRPYETEPGVFAQDIEPRMLQSWVIIIIQIVQANDITALGQQLASDIKPNETCRPCDQNCLFRHRIPRSIGLALPPARDLFNLRMEDVAIGCQPLLPDCP